MDDHGNDDVAVLEHAAGGDQIGHAKSGGESGLGVGRRVDIDRCAFGSRNRRRFIRWLGWHRVSAPNHPRPWLGVCLGVVDARLERGRGKPCEDDAMPSRAYVLLDVATMRSASKASSAATCSVITRGNVVVVAIRDLPLGEVMMPSLSRVIHSPLLQCGRVKPGIAA